MFGFPCVDFTGFAGSKRSIGVPIVEVLGMFVLSGSYSELYSPRIRYATN